MNHSFVHLCKDDTLRAKWYQCHICGVKKCVTVFDRKPLTVHFYRDGKATPGNGPVTCSEAQMREALR